MGRACWTGLFLGIVLSGLEPVDLSAGDPARLTSTPMLVGGGSMRMQGSSPDGAVSYPDAAPRYHNGATAVCDDCHILHASKSHPSGDRPTLPNETLSYAGGTNPFMLKAPDPLDLCLSCHDNHADIPDVMGADVNGLADRSAGHFEQPDAFNPRGHDLGRNLAGRAEPKVTCIDCHNPHGNGVARNLQKASDPESTPDLGLFVNSAAAGMQRYEAGNVSYGTQDSDALREVSNMCLDCHGAFSGESNVDPDGNGIHSRHPTYDSEGGSPNSIAMGAASGHTEPAHWASGVGAGFSVPRVRFVVSGAADYGSATVVDAQRNGVFCLSCHKAHGSDQAFAMTWPVGSTARPPGCDQCHTSGPATPSGSSLSFAVR